MAPRKKTPPPTENIAANELDLAGAPPEQAAAEKAEAEKAEAEKAAAEPFDYTGTRGVVVLKPNLGIGEIGSIVHLKIERAESLIASKAVRPATHADFGFGTR